MIFDYYDYIFKYDFDILTPINIRDFCFNNNVNHKWYLRGTCFGLDSPYVCNNIKRMVLDYARAKKCNNNIINAINLI